MNPTTFTTLPPDLVRQVFSYLNESSALDTDKVCKAWRDNITFIQLRDARSGFTGEVHQRRLFEIFRLTGYPILRLPRANLGKIEFPASIYTLVHDIKPDDLENVGPLVSFNTECGRHGIIFSIVGREDAPLFNSWSWGDEINIRGHKTVFIIHKSLFNRWVAHASTDSGIKASRALREYHHFINPSYDHEEYNYSVEMLSAPQFLKDLLDDTHPLFRLNRKPKPQEKRKDPDFVYIFLVLTTAMVVLDFISNEFLRTKGEN